MQVARAAGLGACAGEPLAAERLHANHRADHIAVDVDVAVGEPGHDPRGGRVDAGMDPKREPEPGPHQVVEHAVELVRPPAHDVKDRAEHLLLELRRTIEIDDGGRHIAAGAQ